MSGKNPTQRGFTLIELLVSLTIIALLLSIAAPKYFQSVDRSKEVVLIENLRVIRKSIDQFYEDNGKYPKDLNELVARRYFRAIPVDPMTNSSESWVSVPPPSGIEGGLYDVRSGADGETRNGTPYDKL